MKNTARYADELLGELRVVKDFLPSPEELALNEDTVRITIALSRSSVEFFKRTAKEHRTQYQKMIRRLLDFYVPYAKRKPLTRRSTGRAEARR